MTVLMSTNSIKWVALAVIAVAVVVVAAAVAVIYFKAVCQYLSGGTNETPVRIPVVYGSRFEFRTFKMERKLFL